VLARFPSGKSHTLHPAGESGQPPQTYNKPRLHHGSEHLARCESCTITAGRGQLQGSGRIVRIIQ
jgi:hypothetical protein